MSSLRIAILLSVLSGLGASIIGHVCARGQTEAVPDKGERPLTGAGRLTALELSGRIDLHLSNRWRKEGLKPAPPADDAAFFRRANLDVAGKIPSVLDIRDFLDDDRPDKRALWIDKILERESYAEHFAAIFRTLFVPETENQQTQFLMGDFETWLRKKLSEGAGYDKMVQELLTPPANPNVGFNPAQANIPSPAAFYAANEYKPENLAGATAKLFLGVKIECAQCHKHPFASWTQHQFWEFAAFFVRSGPQGRFKVANVKGVVAGPAGPVPEIQIPKTNERVKAKFLDGQVPNWQKGGDPVKVLSDWIVSADNPYFARVAVNQVWAYFFGTGLVDPVDDFGQHNPASHPELLDELADQFILSGYDLKYLTRALVNSKAYQLSSAALTPVGRAPLEGGPALDETEIRLFARMPLRTLTGEQLFDSLAEVMELKVEKTVDRQPFRAGPASPREEFVSKFANPENRRVDTQTSILQALHVMNGQFMTGVTNLNKNHTLTAIAVSNVPVSKKIESLFLVALTRQPTASELERLTHYVEKGGASHNVGEALADVLWAILNSAEFAINH